MFRIENSDKCNCLDNLYVRQANAILFKSILNKSAESPVPCGTSFDSNHQPPDKNDGKVDRFFTYLLKGLHFIKIRRHCINYNMYTVQFLGFKTLQVIVWKPLQLTGNMIRF